MGTENRIIQGVIDTSDETRKRYSRDASIFEVTPSAICYPVDSADITALIEHASKNSQAGVSLTARNGGTDMSGGPLNDSIILDMNTGFSWVDEISSQERTVWVGSGTSYRELDSKTRAVGLMFAPYTSSKDLCGIGGMIGNNASGEKSIRFGATIDNVRSVRVVLHDSEEYIFGPLNPEQLQEKLNLETYEGEVYRTVVSLLEDNWDLIWKARPKVRKNAAGYQLWKIWDRDRTVFNLAKLFVGSQGTLGIVTSAELELQPVPAFTKMLVLPISDLSQLANAVQNILLHHPEGLETYDKNTYELAKEYMPEQAALASIAEGQEMMLFAQFSEQTKDATDHAEDVCQKALQRLGFDVHTVNEPAEAEAHWAIRRASYGLLKDHAKNGRAVPFIEDTIVPIDHYGEFVASLQAILEEYNMHYTYAGHIGDGSIRLIPLVDTKASDAPDKILELARRVYDLVFAFGGSMSVDHNDGLIRTPFLERMYGPEVTALFARVKEFFDPSGIFNPRKKVGGNLEYSKAHIIRD